VDLPDINGMNDGDEFVWEDEPAPASDHAASHHHFLDLAAMRARARYGKAAQRRARRAVEPPEAA
jgi:hypothetical protein